MRLLALLFVLACPISAWADATTLEEARAQAAASGRLVLVAGSSKWCGSSQRFHAARESSRRLRRALSRHAFVVIGDATPAGEREQARLGIVAVPTFILMTPNGEEIERWAGFIDVRDFTRRLARAAADPTTLEAKRQRFGASPTPALARTLADSLAARSESVEALRYYDRAMALDPALEKELASERFFTAAAVVAEGDLPFDDLLVAADRYIGALPGNVHVARGAALRVAESVPDDFDRELLRPVIDRALATYEAPVPEGDAAQRDTLLAALRPPLSLDERLAELDAAPSIDATFPILIDLQAAGRHDEAARIAVRTVELAPQHAEQLSLIALSVVAEGVLAGKLSVAELEAAGLRATEAGGGTNEARLRAIGQVARALAPGQDPALLRSEVDAGLAITEGRDDEAMTSLRAELLALRAAVIEKDGPKALALMKESLGDGWEEDASQALDVADFLLDAGIELAEAEALARRALSAVGERDLRTRAALSVARAARAQGRGDAARAVLEAAASEDPRDVRLARALEAF